MIPTIVGLFCVKIRNKALFTLVVYQLLSNVLMVMSQIKQLSKYVHTDYLYYLSCFLSCFAFSLFYFHLFNNYKNRRLFFLFPIMLLCYLLYDILSFGIRQVNMLPFIFIDFIVIVLSIIYLKKTTFLPKYLSILLITEIAYSVFDVFSNGASNYLYQYQNNRYFILFWFALSPTISIFYYAFLTYVFYISGKETRPSFENNPSFE
jgi:hypothetical protein